MNNSPGRLWRIPVSSWPRPPTWDTSSTPGGDAPTARLLSTTVTTSHQIFSQRGWRDVRRQPVPFTITNSSATYPAVPLNSVRTHSGTGEMKRGIKHLKYLGFVQAPFLPSNTVRRKKSAEISSYKMAQYRSCHRRVQASSQIDTLQRRMLRYQT